MKTVTQYREDIKALMDKVDSIRAKCVAENRDPVPEEVSYMNTLLGDVDEIKAIVLTLEREDRTKAALEAPANPPQTTPKSTPAMQVQSREKDRFGSLGEQIAAIMRAGLPGGNVDPRLRITNAASGLNETVPSDGGFLVQQDFATELLQDVMQTGILSQRVRRRIQISGNANGTKINGIDETSRASTRSGGILAYWADEAEEKTKSKPKFRKIELNLKKLIGLCYATDENLADAAQLEGIIREGFRSEFGFQIDDALIRGTGAGQPLGILNAGCLVSVAKEAGQKAATILAENVEKMWSRMFAASLPTAEWFINQNTYPQLFQMSHAVGTGGIPVFLPPGGLSNAPYGSLFGRPVTPIEQCETLGTQGDIIFADFANGYVLAEKGGMQSDMSIHVRFIYDESVFRFVLRIDGQPVRASALTPYKGGATSTLSHFVVLDTRA